MSRSLSLRKQVLENQEEPRRGLLPCLALRLSHRASHSRTWLQWQQKDLPLRKCLAVIQWTLIKPGSQESSKCYKHEATIPHLRPWNRPNPGLLYMREMPSPKRKVRPDLHLLPTSYRFWAIKMWAFLTRERHLRRDTPTPSLQASNLPILDSNPVSTRMKYC